MLSLFDRKCSSSLIFTVKLLRLHTSDVVDDIDDVDDPSKPLVDGGWDFREPCSWYTLGSVEAANITRIEVLWWVLNPLSLFLFRVRLSSFEVPVFRARAKSQEGPDRQLVLESRVEQCLLLQLLQLLRISEVQGVRPQVGTVDESWTQRFVFIQVVELCWIKSGRPIDICTSSEGVH